MSFFINTAFEFLSWDEQFSIMQIITLWMGVSYCFYSHINSVSTELISIYNVVPTHDCYWLFEYRDHELAEALTVLRRRAVIHGVNSLDFLEVMRNYVSTRGVTHFVVEYPGWKFMQIEALLRYYDDIMELCSRQFDLEAILEFKRTKTQSIFNLLCIAAEARPDYIQNLPLDELWLTDDPY